MCYFHRIDNYPEVRGQQKRITGKGRPSLATPSTKLAKVSLTYLVHVAEEHSG